MSRLFDGVDDTVRWGIGGCNLTGAWTMAVLIKLDPAGTWQAYLGTNASGGASKVDFGRHTDDRIHSGHDGSSQFFSASVSHSSADGWAIYAATRAAGAAQPRHHKVIIGGAATHTDATSISGTPANPATQAGGTVRFGEIDGADWFKGRLAAAALWTSVRSDADIEALASTLTRANWLSLAPAGLWDEQDAFQADHTGGGASRTLLTGTTDDADNPAGWASWGDSAAPVASTLGLLGVGR